MQGGIASTLARLGLREHRAAPPESRFTVPEARGEVREYDRAALESRDGLREAEFVLREHRFRLSEQQFRLSEGPARLRESKIRIREHRIRLRESRIRTRESRRGLREYRFGLPESLRALSEHRRVIPEQLAGLSMVKICPTQALWTVRVQARAHRSTRPARAATRRRATAAQPVLALPHFTFSKRHGTARHTRYVCFQAARFRGASVGPALNPRAFTGQRTMSKKNVHVVPHPEGWAVKREGADRASSVHDRKADALDAGRDLARKDEVELVIHGQDGKIQDSDSYGNDPHPPKDEKH